jgi:hypothetical protein
MGSVFFRGVCKTPSKVAHMTNKLALDPKLMDQVLELSAEPTKRAAVTLSL